MNRYKNTARAAFATRAVTTKTVLLLCILLFAFSLSACKGNTQGNYHTGSKGLQAEFFDGYPESEVYESDPLPVALTIRNLGAHDIEPNKLIVSWSYDPLYITIPSAGRITSSANAQADTIFGGSGGSFESQVVDRIFGGSGASFESGFSDLGSLFGNSGAGSSVGGAAYPLTTILHGRSEYYPQGDEVYVEQYDVLTNPIVGLRQSPTTTITAQLCYEYTTQLAKGVCIDVDSFIRTGREQVCKGQDIAGGTQGAPISFSLVEVRSNPVSLGEGSQVRVVRPEFIATITNVGGGVVIAPATGITLQGNGVGAGSSGVFGSGINDFARACAFRDIPTEQLGAVHVNGSLFGIPLVCTPEIVRLRDNVGKTRCTIDSRDLGNPALAIQQNIVTAVQLEAQYIYRDSIAADVKINRNPIQEDEFRPIERVEGYVYSGNDILKGPDGRPLTLCDQKGGNWSCSCRVQECSELNSARNADGSDAQDFCQYSLCPASLYCCDNEGYESFKKEQRSIKT